MNEEKIIRTIYNIWLNNESRHLKFGTLRAKANNELNGLSDGQLRELINNNLNTPEFYNLRASKDLISCSIADYKKLCKDQGRIDLTCGMPSDMAPIDKSELLEYLDNINTLPLKDGEYHVFGKQPINIVYRGCGQGGFSSILYPVQVGQDKFYLINKKPADEAQLDFSDLPLINLEQLKSLEEVAERPWGGFGFYNEALDNEAEFNEFKKKHPEMNKNFDNKKFGKYFDKDGKLIPELKDEYMSVKLFDESFEKKEQTKLTESAKTWTDVYKIFNTLIDIYYPDEDKIDKAVQDVYGPHRGEPIWDEAYKRWNADLDEEEAMAYVMDESLNEDLENVEITDNTTVVPQPTGAAEEESKTLWDRFMDATKAPEGAPLFGAKKQPTPDDVKEPKAELKEDWRDTVGIDSSFEDFKDLVDRIEGDGKADCREILFNLVRRMPDYRLADVLNSLAKQYGESVNESLNKKRLNERKFRSIYDYIADMQDRYQFESAEEMIEFLEDDITDADGGTMLDILEDEYQRDVAADIEDWFDENLNESLNKKSLKEGLDGWDEEKVYDVVNTCNEIYDLNYELENCVKGAYTGVNTYSELADYIITLGNRLAEDGENLKYVDEDPEDEEDVDESFKKKSPSKLTLDESLFEDKKSNKKLNEDWVIKVTDIDWDTDGEDVDLPTEVDIPYYDLDLDGTEEDDYIIEDEISEYLSDVYGWLHNGFDYEVINESLKRNLKESSNDDVTIGIYGDEVDGFRSVDGLVDYFSKKGIRVSDVEGDFDYGWEMNLTGNPRQLFFAVVNTIPGYNSDSVQEFIDEYRIDESFKNKSKRNHKTINEAYIVSDFSDYEPWSGAVDTFNKIKDAGKLDDLEALIDETNPTGIYETELNDLLWFEADWVFQQLGMEDQIEESLGVKKKKPIGDLIRRLGTKDPYTEVSFWCPDVFWEQPFFEGVVEDVPDKYTNVPMDYYEKDSGIYQIYISPEDMLPEDMREVEEMKDYYEKNYPPVHSTPMEKYLEEGASKNRDYDTDEWSVIYYELSAETNEPSYDKVLARKALVNVPKRQKYDKVDPVNDYDLRVYAKDEESFELAKKVANAHGLKYKIEPTNKVHASRFPQEAFQLTLYIPEEKIQSQ